ncbi:endonuclease/exonuclease/phosphatase family protein [Aeromicrobium fastidiosum]|nr:endonuclease/exonuclease/phosphatase family protein [Aeromicrobium fastidiosum]
MRLTSKLVVLAVIGAAATASLPASAVASGAVGVPWVVAASPTSMTLDWPAAGEAGRYRVVHGRTPSEVRRATQAQRTRPATSRLAVTGLRPGTEYCFQVARANRSGRSGVYCHSTPSVVPAAGATPVTVVTFNICGHVCEGWAGRRPAVVRRILDSGADVVALQETTRRGRDTKLLGALRRQGYRLAHDTQNEMVLYRMATVSPAGRVASIQLPWGTVVPGPATTAGWTTFELLGTGKRFTVVSTHFTAGRSLAADRQRKREAARLLALMPGTRAEGPVLYSGDFNSSRARRGDGVGRVFRRAGYVDAYQQSVSHTKAWVSSSNGFAARPRRELRYGDHIDRILVPASLGVSGWEVVAPLRRGKNVRPLASDHHPVRATIWLP